RPTQSLPISPLHRSFLHPLPKHRIAATAAADAFVCLIPLPVVRAGRAFATGVDQFCDPNDGLLDFATHSSPSAVRSGSRCVAGAGTFSVTIGGSLSIASGGMLFIAHDRLPLFLRQPENRVERKAAHVFGVDRHNLDDFVVREWLLCHSRPHVGYHCHGGIADPDLTSQDRLGNVGHPHDVSAQNAKGPDLSSRLITRTLDADVCTRWVEGNPQPTPYLDQSGPDHRAVRLGDIDVYDPPVT